MAHLPLLVVLGIMPILPAYCNRLRKTWMSKFPMRTLSAARNKLEPGAAKIMDELSDFARHGGMLGP
jgi:hypothetical protein